ncbi:MAG: hypothetical protein D6732_16980 [Methanobacteriota archaeon]|nr:MAG: hypothetical protein D6732_16980 [Euryarchaeota archaeon]
MFLVGLAEKDTQPVANGGRLFFLTADGSTIIKARQKGYAAMSCMMIEGNLLDYRTDIG